MHSSRFVLAVVACVAALCLVVDAQLHVPLVRKRQLGKSTAGQVAAFSGQPIPLNGGIAAAGEYYASLYVGTPPQHFEVQVDTGSSDLLINARSCSGCGDTRKYSASSSSTSGKVGCTQPGFTCQTCYGTFCGFDDQYGDGSEVSGYVVSDVLSFGGNVPVANVTFGATEKSTPNFEPTGVDGIWGLAYGSLSSWRGTPPFLRWARATGQNPGYSMCLGANGGSLILGDNFNDVNYQWTPVTQQLWFVVGMTDFQINGQSIGLSPAQYGNSIVDSGTTLFLLPTAAVSAMQQNFRSMCSSTNLVGVCGATPGKTLFDGYCYQMTSSDTSAFPPLSVVINGVSPLTIGPSEYLIDGPQGTKCLGIQGIDGMGTIMGDVFMQKFRVAFDMGRNRVGFAPRSTCPK